MRRAISSILLVFLLLGPSLPLAAAEGGRPVSVVGPDADGTYTLTYEVVRSVAGESTLALHVERESLGETTYGSRSLAPRSFPAGSSAHEVSFLPVEGAGRYTVSLVVDGDKGAPLAFDVDSPSGSSTTVTFEVRDEPTWLNLTNDGVNSDGKLKSPGDALVTRATLVDENGRGDVDAVRWLVARSTANGWAQVDEGALALDAPANATRVDLEHAFERAPLAAGDYRLTLAAIKAGASVAQASRTFAIRDVASVLLAGALSNVTPDAPQRLSTTLVVGDRNALDAGTLELRLYRGSARAETTAFFPAFENGRATIPVADGAHIPDAEGHARRAYPVSVEVPRGAAPGSHRVSVYLDGGLLGTLPFEVAPLPSISSVVANATNDALDVGFELDAPAHVRLTGAGATSQASLAAGAHTIRLARPAGAPAESGWTLTVRAREGGPVVEERAGWWNVSQTTLPLHISLERGGPRLPAAWRVASDDAWDVSGATWNVTVLDWNGDPAKDITGRVADDRVRVDGPADVTPGRYQVVLEATLPNGTRGEARWHFEAGPWMRLTLGAPSVSNRSATIAVTNEGGVGVGRFIVEVDGMPADTVLSWIEDGASRTIPLRNGRAVVTGASLAAGEAGALVLKLPDGPLPSGARQAHVRVLALPGGA